MNTRLFVLKSDSLLFVLNTDGLFSSPVVFLTDFVILVHGIFDLYLYDNIG